jgi:cytochrome c oxidase assembly factor CtaG
MLAAYVVGAMIVGWGLAITLVLVPHPLYPHYAALLHRPGGITAMTDQQLAAGMMWVPGSISYTIAAVLSVYRWLEPQSPPSPRMPVVPT